MSENDEVQYKILDVKKERKDCRDYIHSTKDHIVIYFDAWTDECGHHKDSLSFVDEYGEFRKMKDDWENNQADGFKWCKTFDEYLDYRIKNKYGFYESDILGSRATDSCVEDLKKDFAQKGILKTKSKKKQRIK